MTSFPIAEIFNSIQGEGRFAGTPMTFIRLAGCNVGRPFKEHEKAQFNVVSEYQEKCTDRDGNEFACDTNYRFSERMSLDQLLQAANGMEHVTITGGEPLIHPALVDLVDDLLLKNHYVHIETSGTLAIPEFDIFAKIWVTVSPKLGCLESALDYADEIRVLMGEGFDEDRFLREYAKYIKEEKVTVSPVNGLNELNLEEAAKCVALCLKYPKLRISLQMHKLLNVR